MQRRILTALLLAVVMITAGCTGPGADGTPTGEETDELGGEETPTEGDELLDNETDDGNETGMNETETAGMNETEDGNESDGELLDNETETEA